MSSSLLKDPLRLTAAGFVLLWATGYVVARLAMPYSPPLGFLAWRFGFAVLLLGLVVLWTMVTGNGRPLRWPENPRTWVNIALSGLLVHAGYLSCVWVSIKMGLPAGISALIVNLQPILVASAGRWLGESVSPRQWLGLGIGFAGVLVTVSEKLSTGVVTPVTLSLSVLGLLAITLGTLWQKRRCPSFDLRIGTLIQYAASWVVVGPLALTLEGDQAMVWNTPTVVAMVWSVLLLSFAAIFLMFRLIERGAATRVFAYFYLVPPVTAFMAWLGFGERLSPMAAAGFVVVALGVAMATRPGR